MQRKRARRQRGTTLVEVLAAVFIMGTSMAAMTSLWSFSFRITAQTDRVGAAYTLGRRGLEAIRLTGYENTPDGTTTRYYDRYTDGESATQNSAHVYSVTTTTTTAATPVVDGTTLAASFALRTVQVQVRLISSNELLYQVHTCLTQGGA